MPCGAKAQEDGRFGGAPSPGAAPASRLLCWGGSGQSASGPRGPRLAEGLPTGAVRGHWGGRPALGSDCEQSPEAGVRSPSACTHSAGSGESPHSRGGQSARLAGAVSHWD